MSITLEGVVITGLGEGAFFLSIDHYKNEINKVLGFIPYPGTLNIKTQHFNKEALKNKKRIEGFEQNGRKFSGVSLAKATILNTEGALIFPDISKQQENIIEFIAPMNMRKECGFKDYDTLTVSIE